jgi:MoaA/NifB/PqqE/SkfB family radical SAM enzyme
MGITWGQLGDNLIEQAKEKRIPLIGQFELTARCNLQCKMCYVCQPANDKQAIAKERTAKEWIKLAEEARDVGMLYLLLTGGEVFLRKDFRQIYEALSMMGFIIEIYTNATLITSEVAKWLGKIPPARVGITLYGSSPETYSKVCGRADGFKLAIEGMDALIEQGIVPLLKTTIIKGNSNEFDNIRKLAANRKLEFGIVNYVSPRREGNRMDPCVERLSPKELAGFEAYVESCYPVDDQVVKSSSNADANTLDSHKECESKINIKNTKINQCFYCNAGSCAFWITWDGRMTPCGLMTDPIVFPFEKGLSRSWSELKELCSLIPDCEECKLCKYKQFCMTCPARLKNETGVFTKPSPYLCELARERKSLEKNNVNKASALKLRL